MSSADATRDRVLAAAMVLLERGESPTMGAIAEQAGVSRQLLYLRFEGRADLLLDVSRRVDAEVRTPALQASVDEASDAVTALERMVEVQGAIKPRIEPVVRAMQHLAGEDADIAAALGEREAARRRRVGEVVTRLAVEGCLADGWDTGAATDLAWSATSQRAWRDLTVDAGWSTEEWVRRTTAALHAALVAHG